MAGRRATRRFRVKSVKVTPRGGSNAKATAGMRSLESRALNVYRKTWKLVAPELGGPMPEVVFHRYGDGVEKPTPGAAMWAERREYPLERLVEMWEEAGRPANWVPPRREIVHVTPEHVELLASDDPAVRRREQKHLFHEFKHTRQPDELRDQEAAREWDASQYARSRSHLLRKKRKKK